MSIDLTQRLILGEAITELRQMETASLGALVCDPPYSSGGLHATDRKRDPKQKYEQTQVTQLGRTVRPTFSGDSRDQRSWTFWSILWLSECYRLLKDGAPVVCFIDWRQLPAMTDAFQAAGFIWRGISVWDKTEQCRPQKGRFSNQCEYMVWGSKGAMPRTRNAPVLPGAFRYPIKQADKHHLTGKPTPLLREILRIVEPGETVLDCFMGSGTTCVAAGQLGLGFVGIEWDQEYYAIAEGRIANEVKIAQSGASD